MPTGRKSSSSTGRSHHQQSGTNAHIVSVQFRFRSLADTSPSMAISPGPPRLIGAALAALVSYADLNRSTMIGSTTIQTQAAQQGTSNAGQTAPPTTPHHRKRRRTAAQLAADKKRSEMAIANREAKALAGAKRKAHGKAATA